MGVFGRRYESSETPVEFQVNSYTSANQWLGGVAATAGGHFVVTWSSDGQDGSGLGVFAQRFAPDVIFEDGFQ